MAMLLKRKMCRYNTPSRSIDILIKCWYWGRCGMWVSSGSDVCHLLPAPAPVRNHCILCCAAWCVINGRGEEFELWVGGGPQDYSDSPSPILTLNNWDFLVFDSNGLDLGLGNWTWACQFKSQKTWRMAQERFGLWWIFYVLHTWTTIIESQVD